jgi:hypothetical protein
VARIGGVYRSIGGVYYLVAENYYEARECRGGYRPFHLPPLSPTLSLRERQGWGEASRKTRATLGDKSRGGLVYRPTLNISTKVKLFSITVIVCPYLFMTSVTNKRFFKQKRETAFFSCLIQYRQVDRLA